MKKSIFALAISTCMLFAGVPVFAQSLGVSDKEPTIDGVTGAGEYGYVKEFGAVTVFLQRTKDTLSIAVAGKTSGWVAIGLDSSRMDSAVIFMGFAADGKPQFTAQIGSGHGHGDADAQTAASVISYAVKEAGGKTVLELKVKSSPYIPAGGKELNIIYAMGSTDSFSPPHSFRGTAQVPLT